jgi:citrate synthase
MADIAKLTVGDRSIEHRSIELPIVEGSEGERGIDIRKLRSEMGLITLDPGYANTGSCQSRITFIDGDKGILRYRGIPIEWPTCSSTEPCPRRTSSRTSTLPSRTTR